MFKSKFALFFISAIFSSSAMAVCNSAGCVNEYVQTLYPNTNGVIYVRTTGNDSLVNCDLVGNVYMKISANQTGKNDLYSTLLAAFISDRKIQIRVIEGSQGCEIAYVRFERP